MAGWASDLADWASGLAGWASGLAGKPRGGWMNKRTNERTNEQTNEQTENIPILQDFVPYRGRYPKTIYSNCENKAKKRFPMTSFSYNIVNIIDYWQLA